MMRTTFSFISLLGLAVGLVLAPVFASDQAMSQSIPATKTETLAGRSIQLPEELKGRALVFVFGFSKKSGEAVRLWNQQLAPALAGDTGVLYLEGAILADVPDMVRGFVIRGIKKSIPGPDQERFLSIVEDEDAWKKVANYREPDEAYVLVTDPAGVVRMVMHGPVSAAKRDAVITKAKEQGRREKGEGTRDKGGTTTHSIPCAFPSPLY